MGKYEYICSGNITPYKTFNPLEDKQRTYIAIDLKSFYASVECVERGLDPLTTNLVVADASRTEKTICLAVSPSLKQYGIGGRARLFEVVQRLREVNYSRRMALGMRAFEGKSVSDTELKARPELEVDYIAAVPRMAYYIEYSTRIYKIYLKYLSPEDIHVYSIDEVLMDVTDYLTLYHTMAMDIMAKKQPADKDGVRIAELDEMSYRRQLWDHRPLTDFWRVGRGIANQLAAYGIDTMGKVARCSVENEELLYRLFGVNAELLIDHAWGWEPCTIDLIKAYRPESNSFSHGQVLSCPYTWEKARVVVQEMADAMVLELVEKRLVTDQLVLTISYDAESLTNPAISRKYTGPRTTDYYGRTVPKAAHGTAKLKSAGSSSKVIIEAVMQLYDNITNPDLLIRYINLTTNHIMDEQVAKQQAEPQQLDLFTDYEALERQRQAEEAERDKERKIQEVQIQIKKRFGKNAILKGLNFEEGATARDRNNQIGGHKA